MAERDLPELLTLDDPHALRALAHPVRQQLITLLYGGAELTATQAAELCGVTPSAMSYHLRALERWGFVQRGEPRSDARERPWRAAAKRLDLQTGASQSPAATGVLLHSILAEADRSVAALLARPREPEVSGTIRRGATRLTPAQAEAMNAEIHAVLDRYDDPAGGDPTARRWDIYYLSLPGEPPG